MAMLSKSALHAFWLLARIAGNQDMHFTAKDLTGSTDLATPSIAKLLHRLAKDGILESRKGPGGGFRSVVAPEEITLARVIRAVEELSPAGDAIFGKEEALSPELSAFFKKIFSPYRELLQDRLESLTLREFIQHIDKLDSSSEPLTHGREDSAPLRPCLGDP